MHPLISSYIVPNPSLCTLPTISLVDPSSLFQLQPHIFGNWCLHGWHDHTTTDGFKLSHPQSSQQHPPYHEEHQSTPYQPVSYHTSSWFFNASTHLASSKTASFYDSQRTKNHVSRLTKKRSQQDKRLTCLGTSEQWQWTLWHFVHWIELHPTSSTDIIQIHFQNTTFLPK